MLYFRLLLQFLFAYCGIELQYQKIAGDSMRAKTFELCEQLGKSLLSMGSTITTAESSALVVDLLVQLLQYPEALLGSN